MAEAQALPSVDDRWRFSASAEPFRLRAAAPHVHGYVWRSPQAPAAVVFLHGLQSHAQWFAEAGALLHARGLSVYAVDRRGSGSSPGPRGHITRWHEWIDEVLDVVAAAAHETGAPVHLAGHCFGANLAIGAALARPDAVASVTMLTPGLFVIPDYSWFEKVHIVAYGLAGRDVRFRVPQDDALFTRDPDVLAWIRADAHGARTVTAKALVEIGRMRRILRAQVASLRVPVLVCEAARDRIADNRRNRRLLDAALGARCRWRSFDAEHFLLTEPCRDDVLETLHQWVLAPGAA